MAKRRAPAVYETLNRRDLEAFLGNWANDGTFVFPGDIDASGTHSGKEAVRAWFQGFLEQFSTIRFTIKHVAVADLFDMVGNNVIAMRWEVELTNREGFDSHNSGVSVIRLRRGKIVHVQDFLFDTGEKFHTAWGQGKQKV